jgi:hypothetical protein
MDFLDHDLLGQALARAKGSVSFAWLKLQDPDAAQSEREFSPDNFFRAHVDSHR